MTSDPEDYIYIEKQVGGDRRRTRRHVTIADRDWRPVGDPAAPGGAEARLRATVVVNTIPLDVELLSCASEQAAMPGDDPRPARTVRVRGRLYRVLAVYTAQEA